MLARSRSNACFASVICPACKKSLMAADPSCPHLLRKRVLTFSPDQGTVFFYRLD
jgi:hypothetical protein